MKHLLFPQDIDLIVERYQLLYILVLGEFVVAATKIAMTNHHSSSPAIPESGGGSNHTVVTHAPTPAHVGSHRRLSSGGSGGEDEEACYGVPPSDGLDRWRAIIAILAVVAMKVLYFELSDGIRPSSSKCLHPDGPRHALQRTFWQALSWTLLHAPLFIAMICIASVFEIYIEGDCLEDNFVVLFSISTFVVIMALTIMGLTHTSGDPRIRTHRGCLRKQYRTLLRFLLAIIALATSTFALFEKGAMRSHATIFANTVALLAVAAAEGAGRYPVTVSDKVHTLRVVEPYLKNIHIV